MPASLRFPKCARLIRASEFLKVKNEGQSFHGRYLVLSVFDFFASEPSSITKAKQPSNHSPHLSQQPLQSPQLIQQAQPARIGIITSRRVGSAVVRNRTRRRLRELARASRPRVRGGLWLVLIARASAAKASFRELEKDWLTLAKRAAIFRECR